MPKKQNFVLVIDLDERGLFKAHVEDASSSHEAFAFSNEGDDGWPDEDGLWLVNDGYMRHGRDVCGLLEYMQSAGIAGPNASLRLEG